MGSQHFWGVLQAHGLGGPGRGRAKDLLSASEGLYLSQICVGMMVKREYIAVVTIAIDVAAFCRCGPFGFP